MFALKKIAAVGNKPGIITYSQITVYIAATCTMKRSKGRYQQAEKLIERVRHAVQKTGNPALITELQDRIAEVYAAAVGFSVRSP